MVPFEINVVKISFWFSPFFSLFYHLKLFVNQWAVNELNGVFFMLLFSQELCYGKCRPCLALCSNFGFLPGAYIEEGLFVSMLKLLRIVILVVMGIIFLGDTFCLESNHIYNGVCNGKNIQWRNQRIYNNDENTILALNIGHVNVVSCWLVTKPFSC